MPEKSTPAEISSTFASIKYSSASQEIACSLYSSTSIKATRRTVKKRANIVSLTAIKAKKRLNHLIINTFRRQTKP